MMPSSRFICPHCHSPLDPHSMDTASSNDAQLRICPNCDEPVVLALGAALPTSGAASSPRLAENAAR